MVTICLRYSRLVKTAFLCSVVLVQIIKATDSCEGVLWRFVLADVWPVSIQHANTVVLCLRLAVINGHPHKAVEFPIKPRRIEETKGESSAGVLDGFTVQVIIRYIAFFPPPTVFSPVTQETIFGQYIEGLFNL